MKQRIAAAMLITLIPSAWAACGGANSRPPLLVGVHSPPRTLPPCWQIQSKEDACKKSKRRWQTPAKL